MGHGCSATFGHSDDGNGDLARGNAGNNAENLLGLF